MNSTASQIELFPLPFRPVIIVNPDPKGIDSKSLAPRKPDSSIPFSLMCLLECLDDNVIRLALIQQRLNSSGWYAAQPCSKSSKGILCTDGHQILNGNKRI